MHPEVWELLVQSRCFGCTWQSLCNFSKVPTMSLKGMWSCKHRLHILRGNFFSFFLIHLFVCLFIYGCVGSLLLRTGFLQLLRAGATLCCTAWASHCGGFSCCTTWALGTQASVVVALGLQQLWLTGSRAQAQQLWCMGLVAPWHVGSSQTRARTCVPYIGRWILNHCATREVIVFFFIRKVFLLVPVQEFHLQRCRTNAPLGTFRGTPLNHGLSSQNQQNRSLVLLHYSQRSYPGGSGLF